MPAFSSKFDEQVVRFGVFELDLSAGELRKSGVKLRLQEQPFQVLAMLLQRHGEVVTREDCARNYGPPTPSWISTMA